MRTTPRILQSSGVLVCLFACGAVPPREEALDSVAAATSAQLGLDASWSATDARAATDSMISDGVLTADEAVRIALANNPRLRGIMEELNISRAEVWQAVLPPNPVLTAEWLWLRHDPGEVVELSGTIDLVELLLIPVRRQVAMSRYEEAKALVAGAVIELAVETRHQYRRLQAQLAYVDAIRDSRSPENAETRTDDTPPGADATGQPGTRTADERLLAEASLFEQEQRIGLASAIGHANAMRENLALLLGLQVGTVDFDLDPNLPEMAPLSMDSAAVESAAVEASFDLAAARARVTALGQATCMRRIETVFEHGDVGMAADKGEHDGDNHDNDDEDDEWAIGPTARFSIPLFDWGKAAEDEARARMNREMQNLTDRALYIRRVARASWIIASTAEANLRYSDEYVRPLWARAYDGDLDAAARARFVDARLRSIETLREYWIARSDLEALMLGVVPSHRFGFGVATRGIIDDPWLRRQEVDSRDRHEDD